MKKRVKMMGLLLGLVCLVGCTAITDKNNDNQALKTVNIAISNEGKADLLDATSYDAAMALYGAVYEPLIEYTGKGEFKAGLSESWDISEDGKKYTFHLKKNSKFSDGSKVDAEAVKFTIERAKYNNETTSLQTLTNLEKITVIDENTVEMLFTTVSNQVLSELCQTRPLRIMSPNAVENQKIDGELKKAIGSGPFVVEESSDEQTVMKANPYFNHETPVNYKVTFQTIEDGSSRSLALKSGEIDIAGGTLGDITDSDISSLKKDKKYNVHEFTGTMSHFLAFNPDNSQLSATIRNGIEVAINKSELSDKKLVGLFRENVQYVTEENQHNTSYDLDKAKQIFESQGYKLNQNNYYEKGNETLQFTLVIQTTEFPEWKEKAEVIESELKNAGVKLNIQILDKESYYDVLWKTKKYDLIFYRTYTDALLPYNFLNSLFQNQAGTHGVLANDEKLTNLLNDYATTNDKEKQQDIFNKIFARLSEETLAIPIEYKNENFVTSEKISTFEYSGLSDAPIDFKRLAVR
ncbi:nickel ABC transporter substrate-binding protein [Enterococcus ureasiticus]|uniref:ABC transporter substrate-binding protein n=1 Tax=Enterococcus ureasiticus TaxID=903984 RepID=UPI001A90A877|nr:ABC transporter substrate-binding protein [Enterococcus ureasiticus]MBO0474849.1 nickel ABC transporter substrate-binding protein [Enterococcus ureasiticus]